MLPDTVSIIPIKNNYEREGDRKIHGKAMASQELMQGRNFEKSKIVLHHSHNVQGDYLSTMPILHVLVLKLKLKLRNEIFA
jgi:hypothetical protein